MPGRSMQNQANLIQRETTPGTANTTAMLKLSSLKFRPGWAGEAEPFRGGSSKVATSVLLADEHGAWAVEGVQDFNHLGLVAASRIDGLPTTTTPTGATNARQHVFGLGPDAADPTATYTVQYGDATKAVQGVYTVFNRLGMTVRRGQLEFSTSMISKTPDPSITLASTGITTMPAAPIPPKLWDLWVDPTWAGLGTTQYLGAYEGGLDLGDKYEMDAPINSSIVSFESLLEAEDQGYAFNLRVGFDAAAQDLFDALTAGSLRFFRLGVSGGLIETGQNYLCQVDFAAFILSRGEMGAAPNSSALSVPLTLALAKDPVTNKALELTLVNAISGY